ncbi:MAG: hypothetical protein OEX81_05200 [Candidatus Pacebacteria bacterium]|nr:hypothetical protein [Candidatus Paceibacterota bacterium]
MNSQPLTTRIIGGLTRGGVSWDDDLAAEQTGVYYPKTEVVTNSETSELRELAEKASNSAIDALSAVDMALKALNSTPTQISYLSSKYFFKRPLSVITEYDEEYISYLTDIPVYAVGENKFESIENLKVKIVEYYEVLVSEKENLSQKLKSHHFFLNSVIQKIK